MRTTARNLFTTIRTEGALLPADFLQQVAEGNPEIEGLSQDSYHLVPGEKLNEAINRSWNRLLGAWTAFKDASEKLVATRCRYRANSRALAATALSGARLRAPPDGESIRD
jgi:hypothetical protein